MTSVENAPPSVVSLEDMQKGWHELILRVGQLEAERSALEVDNKSLRFLLERVVDHREKSHAELVMILAGLVSKLPINDVGVVVSRLMEHSTRVCEVCAALTKGTLDVEMTQPSVIKALDQTKRDLTTALKQAVEDLVKLDPPLELNVLQNFATQPESFFAPAVVRASRCYLKGQLPRERVAREFGEPALALFNDMTTDPKLNPRPKPEEIVLVFKHDFNALLPQTAGLTDEQRQKLAALHQKVHRSKTPSEHSRAERMAFQKMAFPLELLHYYDNSNTEAPDVVFAQRLPALIEQLALAANPEKLEEKNLVLLESLLAHIIQPDHRLMVVNNLGKGGGLTRTLKYVLRLRMDKTPDLHELSIHFVKHLLSEPSPTPQNIAAILRLVSPDMQQLVIGAIISFDKLRREEADVLGRAVAKELGVTLRADAIKEAIGLSPEMERQLAWEKVKELIASRGNPAAVAAVIRERLHAKYDSDEVKQSWVTLTEADAMSLIRVFCLLPYLPDGSTDSVARVVMETYVTRLMHEKYAAVYSKILNSLKNMFKVKQDSPTLVNFLALVRWVDPAAADKMSMDIGIPEPAPQ